MPRRLLLLLTFLSLALAACNMPGSNEADQVEEAVRQTLEVELTVRATAEPTAATATATEAPLTDPAPSATPSSTVNPYTVSARVDANCRQGPRTLFPVEQVVRQAEQVEATARNNDPNNVWLEVHTGTGDSCWMSAATLNLTFDPLELPVGNIPPTPVFTPGAIVGTVWHDLCDSDSPDPTACEQVDGEYQANGLLDLGEMTIVGVTVQLGAGDCPSIGLTQAQTGPDASGGYEFDGLVPGKYCVTVDANSAVNADILGSGRWTWPEGFGSDVARQTVTVESGQTTPAVTFGWDFADLP